MTDISNAFHEALSQTIKDSFPIDHAVGFTMALPVDTNSVKIVLTTGGKPTPTNQHDTLLVKRFGALIKKMFQPGEIGDVWKQNTPLMFHPAKDFGLVNWDDVSDGSWKHQHIRHDNFLPRFQIDINPKWKQIEHFSWTDGTIYVNQKTPLFCKFKNTKSQAELKRFFHMMSAFQGNMTLWSAYCNRQRFTIRAPNRETACFLAYVCINANKAFKEDNYTIDKAWRVYCNPIDNDETIEAYQKNMKAISI